MQQSMKGLLALADGTVFEGISIGYPTGLICGEVVFNTGQTGYQEILTDPSYAEQIIVFTQPHIGNTGINSQDMESAQIFAKGAIMRSYSHYASNWRSQKSLQHFFHQHKTIALSEIDTRALTLHLRKFGNQAGCIMAGQIDHQTAIDYAQRFPGLSGKDLIKQVSTVKPYTLGEKKRPFPYHIVVYDFGVKASILNSLTDRGCALTVVPANTEAAQVLALNPDGIVLSNGPGDPAAATYAIKTVRSLLIHRIPLLAICFGHQLLALASGAKTKKMTFGHHGTNHPIISLKTGRVSISSQNHGFVVEENLPPILRITHRSLFDGTIAGIERIDAPAFGFQGHPEAGPGPTELNHLFDHFLSSIEVNHAKAS